MRFPTCSANRENRIISARLRKENDISMQLFLLDVFCIDGTRVVLQYPPGGNDYIHANYVGVRNNKRRFICTQVTTPNNERKLRNLCTSAKNIDKLMRIGWMRINSLKQQSS